MSRCVTLHAWGVPIQLEGPDEAWKPVVDRLVHGPGRPTGPRASFRWSDHRWWRDGHPVADLEKALELEIATRSPGHVFVHAGVVRCGQAALLLPGASRAGKSTLVRALTERGASYYSDEFAVLDRRGRVRPYPRRLSLRSGERLSPTDLGWSPSLGPVRVGAVLECCHGATSVWRERTPAQALVALFAHAVAARSRPGEVLQVLKRALSGALYLEGTRAEADDTADWILSWLGKEAPWPLATSPISTAEPATPSTV